MESGNDAALRGREALITRLSEIIEMVKKVIRHDKVTREQYDKLQVDVVNRLEKLEAKEAYDSKDIRGQVARANSRLYAEIKTLQEKQNKLAQANNNRLSDIRVIAVLWGITTIGVLAEILII